MFRLKITIIYLVLTLIGVALSVVILDQQRERVGELLEADVVGSAPSYQAQKRVRDLELRDTAVAVARSELRAYLGVLEDYRRTMLEIEAEVYHRFPGSQSDEGLKHSRIALVASKKDFLDGFSEALARRLEAFRGPDAWKDKSRAQTVAEIQETLRDCNAFAVNNCFFRFTYYPLKKIVEEIRRDRTYGISPDLVVVVDDRGTGLADANRPRWSDDTRFAERYPVVRAAREGRSEGAAVKDVLRMEDPARYVFVAVAPVIESAMYRGAVMVGLELDRELLDSEVAALGHAVSYLDGKQLIKSSMDPDLQPELLHNQPPRSDTKRLYTLESERIVAELIPLTGNHLNNDIVAVISADRRAALNPLDMLYTIIPLVALAMFLAGVIGFMIVIRQHTKPFEVIDSGIHEIINGNRDYEFPYDIKEPPWASLASSLNMMVGTLLGREMEEDHFVDEEWQQRIQTGEFMSVQLREDSQISVIPSDLADTADSELATEPTDAYYRRLHREYAAILERRGERSISLEDFVDRVTRQERQFRNHFGSKMVRFRVTEGRKGPELVAVRID